MERNMRMVLALFGVVAAVMLQCAAAQTVHVVGDASGWIVPQNGAEAYVSWASDKTFVVGDTLIFNFVTNEHDVLQVTKDSYDACTDTNPIGNPITTGPANITLTSAGDHYYICTYGRHCASGQKLTITVSATGTPGAAPPPSTTAAPPPPPPSTPSPTSSTTPEACAPEPSATNPTANAPTSSTTPGQVAPPPPDSSSPAVSGGFFVTILSIAMAALF
ncbi:cucumber peeling cupredoxin-like [Rhododendron vialii]|uniref:cucumber peeling cupredoxin-like n=1 Tax=Rhododendron vialii TaxID=182163 RepID=UPI00265E0A62|nr:cucumber peeling cupredoxin-like [Rhododendron vialii]